MNARRAMGARATTTISGINPIHASHHRLKSGKERTSKRAEPVASELSGSDGRLARTIAASLNEGFRFGASRAAASCMRRSLPAYRFAVSVRASISLNFGNALAGDAINSWNEFTSAKKLSGSSNCVPTEGEFQGSTTKTVTVKVTNCVVLTESMKGSDRLSHSGGACDFHLRVDTNVVGFFPGDRRNGQHTVPKCGRTRSFLTGFQFGGIKLKGCSAGGWRSGMQR